MGKACTVSDSTLEDLNDRCPSLGVAPKHKRKPFTIRPHMTHKEISEELGITRQAVQYIERRALKKLRMMLQ